MRRLILIMAAFLAVAFGAAVAFDASKTRSAAAETPAAIAQPLRSDPHRVFLAPEQRREAFASKSFPATPLSLLRVEKTMHYGDWKWDDSGVPPGPTSIRVDLRTQLLSVFRGGHEIGTAVVLYGADAKETPLGRFPILWKGRNHRSSLYDAPMPYTLRLTGDGVAIHGSNVRWGAATHGCIGVPTDFAAHLYKEAKLKDPVLVVRTSEQGKRPNR